MTPLQRAAIRLVLPLLAAGIAAAQEAPPRQPLLEVGIWGGYSTFAADAAGGRTAQAGLRSLEVAVWPSGRLRLFGRYENSLTLDNLTVVRANRSVPTWQGGTLFNWGGRLTTVIEVGRRTLPGSIGQTQLGAEQVLYLPGGTALKAGGWIGPRQDHRTEWLGHAGVSVAVGTRWRVEPTAFYAETGIPGEHSWRALLNSELRLPSDFRLGLGVAAGHNHSFDGSLTGAVWDSYVRASIPVSGLNRLHLLVRHQRAAGASTLTTIAIGATLGVPRP